jgi:hypothetical protein
VKLGGDDDDAVTWVFLKTVTHHMATTTLSRGDDDDAVTSEMSRTLHAPPTSTLCPTSTLSPNILLSQHLGVSPKRGRWENTESVTLQKRPITIIISSFWRSHAVG